jgi:hypothetical protein
MVFHISAGGDWKNAFKTILSEPSVLTGKKNDCVVLQEQAIGTEYAIGTVSNNGKHYLVHVMKYNKIAFGGRETVYDYVEFVPSVDGELWKYVQESLDALGVRYGATHTEVFVTNNGPRLIEMSTRMIGGPVVGFARAATGSSQADKLAEIYIDGDVKIKEFIFKKTVVPVFLKATRSGIISNIEVFDGAAQLPTLLYKYVWVKNEQRVPQTIDYLTAIGIIALTGDRDRIFDDYKKIRTMESQLVIR